MQFAKLCNCIKTKYYKIDNAQKYERLADETDP